MKMKLTLAVTLISVTALAWAAGATDNTSKPATKPAATAPAFTLNDAAGKAVSLSDFTGKIVVLEWTNPDCPFVRRAYRNGLMIDTFTKYKDKGIGWVAINSSADSAAEKNKKWSDAQKLPYPILDDHEGKVGRLYHARSTPSVVVIDAAGNIAYRGAVDNGMSPNDSGAINYVDQALADLTANKTVSTNSTPATGTPVTCGD